MRKSLSLFRQHLTHIFCYLCKCKDHLRSFTSRFFLHQPAHSVRKETLMNSMNNSQRSAFVLTTLVAAAALAACSKGGGNTPPPPPPPPAAAKATVVLTDMTTTGVVPATNTVKFKLDVSGEGVTKVDATVTELCDGNSVTVTMSTIPITGGTVTAVPVAGTQPNGAACTYTVTATATNAGGISDPVTATGAFRVMYKYARLNVGVFSDQNKRLFVMSGETVTPMGNKTGYDNLFLCGLYDLLLSTGGPLGSCVTPNAGNTRRYFPINPLTGELMAEVAASAIPAGAVFHSTAYGTFGDTPYASYGVTRKSMYIDVPGAGTYYFTSADSVNLRLTRDGFASYKIISTCPALSCFDGLFTFSNP